MTGPGGAFTLTSLQVLAGTFVFMWFTQLRWRIINRGYFRSTTWVLWPLMGALTLVLPPSLRALGAAATIAFILFLVGVYSQRPLLEWTTGAAASAASIALLIYAGSQSCADCPGILHSLVGAVLLGAATHGMVLGHWYLNQARLPLEPLKQAVVILAAALGIALAVGLLTGADLREGVIPSGILAVKASTYWWTWVVLISTTAVISWMVWQTIKERATQSATGLLYIAIVTALGAQFILDLLVAT
ncbi:MAG TPA: hypothetical protein VNA87_01220 [Actinomycetota bacterium]|nr:hypothetical protein [Actinomycetota bacterium]